MSPPAAPDTTPFWPGIETKKPTTVQINDADVIFYVHLRIGTALRQNAGNDFTCDNGFPQDQTLHVGQAVRFKQHICKERSVQFTQQFVHNGPSFSIDTLDTVRVTFENVGQLNLVRVLRMVFMKHNVGRGCAAMFVQLMFAMPGQNGVVSGAAGGYIKIVRP